MNTELIAYYVNLLIIQYNTQPKARATVDALIELLMIYDLIIKVRDGYSLDDAEGKQLDILGKYLGEDRTITGTTFTRDYFGFSSYGSVGTRKPYLKYGEPAPDVATYSYKDSNRPLYDLNDSEYRRILRFKLIQNSSNYSTKSIDDFIAQYFGDTVIFNDRENMSISYIFQSDLERLVTIAQSEGLLPKPAGVGISLSFVPDISHIFGFSRYGHGAADFVSGFSKYGESTPEGSWLRYGT